MRTVQSIYRYPIKGLSPEALPAIELEAGRPFPFDRVFALARRGTAVDTDPPVWGKKGLFVMLMLDEALAQVETRLDPATLQLEVLRHGKTDLCARLDHAQGRAAVEAYFKTLAPRLEQAPRLVGPSAGHFMDKPDPVLSLINLRTLRSLEELWGHPVEPLRFRANFYIEGLSAWEEFDWIGGEIQLGQVVLRVDRRNGRCGATNVNPRTGQRDRDIPGALRRDFGHKDLGIYVAVRRAGRVAVGDAVSVAAAPSAGHLAAGTATSTAASIAHPLAAGGPGRSLPARFMCRGCYFIYDEASAAPAAGVAAAMPFADLEATWRCPDCGTDKSSFARHGD